MFISNAQKENIKMEIISLKARINVQEKAMEEAATIIRLLNNKIESFDKGEKKTGWSLENRKAQSDRIKAMWAKKKAQA